MSKAYDTYIRELARKSESPGKFLKAVMGMKGIKPKYLANQLGVTQTFIRLIDNDFNVPHTKTCYKIASILDIDPIIYNRLCADYKMKQVIKEEENGTRESIQETFD